MSVTQTNHLANMIRLDLEWSDPHHVSDLAYNRKEVVADSFKREIDCYLNPKRTFFNRIKRKKKVEKLTLDQLVSLFDMILLYQNMSYFANRGKYPLEYPDNLEWIEDDEEDKDFNLTDWIDLNIKALNRISEDVEDHEHDGIIALGAFLSILKPYDIPMEKFHEAWLDHYVGKDFCK